MLHYKRKISFLKGTFNNNFLELRYRQGSFRNDLDVNRLAFFLIAVVSILFIQNDEVLLRDAFPLTRSIEIRSAFAIFSVCCILLLSRVNKFYHYDLIVAFWLVILISLLVFFDLSRPPEYQIYVLIDMLVIVGIYVLFVFGLRSQTLMAVGFTVVSLGIVFWFKEFPNHVVVTIMIGFILSNILGFVLASRFHYLRRVDFFQRRELSQQAQRLNRAALRDPLTDLWNRRSYDDQILGMFDNFKRYQQPFSLVLIDIDFFKRVNDTYGHLDGDRVLKEFATLLKRSARPGDQVFRYGGEEFVMLLSNTTLTQAEIVSERVRKKLKQTHLLEKYPELNVSASFGVADVQGEDTNTRSIFHRADKALYIAKQSGRDQVVIAIDDD